MYSLFLPFVKVPQIHAGGTRSPGFHEEPPDPFVHKPVFVAVCNICCVMKC